jgi:hypothetical protein
MPTMAKIRIVQAALDVMTTFSTPKNILRNPAVIRPIKEDAFRITSYIFFKNNP